LEPWGGRRRNGEGRAMSLPTLDGVCQQGRSGIAPGASSRHKEEGMKRLLTLTPIAVLLAACEDAGNSGDDNLLTGGSLVLIVIIVVIVLVVRRRR
jgi:hypothetical protein